MSLHAFVLDSTLAEPHLVARTLRSLSARGFPASAVTDLSEIEGPCLLARAGAWLVDPAHSFIPEPGTWVGLGAESNASWRKWLARCGGDLSRLPWPHRRLPGLPPFVLLSAEALVELRQRLPGTRSLERALSRVILGSRRRAVHLPQLDGCFAQGLRTVQAVTSIHIGGAEKIAIEISAGLNLRGQSSLVAALGAPERAELTRPDHFVDLSGEKDRTGALEQAALRFGADLIHAHLLRGEMIRDLTRRGWPVVASLHNTRQAWPSGTTELREGDVALVVACSRAVEDDFLQAASEAPVRTAWNGVEPGPLRSPRWDGACRERLGIPRAALVILALANVRPQKRFDRLHSILEACRSLRADVHLIAAGAGTPDLADAQNFHRLGLVQNPGAILAAADLLVCPSAHEGLSLAQLEALACGKPVVATDVGGAREVAGVRLVPLDADPMTIATACLDAATGPAPALPSSFTREAMVGRLSWLYPRALARHRLRGRGPEVDLWLVTNNFFTGGAQSSARRLLEGLKQRGYRVRAAAIEEGRRGRSRGRTALEQAGISAFVPSARAGDDTERISAELALAMDECPPRAVAFWNLIASSRVLLADGLLGTRIFDVSPGEMTYVSLDRYFARPRTGLPYRTPLEYGRLLAGAVVKHALERETAAATLGCAVHVIPNGVELPSLPRHATRSGRRILATAARLSEDKRLEDLLDAVRQAHERLPPYELWIAGGPDGDDPGHARKLRRLSSGLPVRWLGELPDTQDLLARADLFLMISEPAGCPNASLEALAHGVPVIATDHGGAREQVIDGVNGRLVPRQDTRAFAEAVVELANSPDRLRHLGDAAREHARASFSLDLMLDRYAKVFWG